MVERSSLFEGEGALSFTPFLFHAFQGAVPSDLNPEASFESRHPESGCQPQRLASLEEREEEGDAERKQHRLFNEHASSVIVANFRGLCSPHRGKTNGLAASAVAVREDEPPCDVAATEVARGRRRKRKEHERGSDEQGRRPSPSSSSVARRKHLFFVRAPPRLVFSVASRAPSEDAPETESGVCVGECVRRK